MGEILQLYKRELLKRAVESYFLHDLHVGSFCVWLPNAISRMWGFDSMQYTEAV